MSAGEGGPRTDVRLWGVEEIISRVLLVGGLVSITIALLGMAAYFASAAPHAGGAGLSQLRTARPPAVFVSVREVVRGLTRHPIDPLAAVSLGLLLLMITPLVGVAIAVPAFLSIRDYDYAVIASIVLAILVVSLFLGGAG